MYCIIIMVLIVPSQFTETCLRTSKILFIKKNRYEYVNTTFIICSQKQSFTLRKFYFTHRKHYGTYRLI